MTSALRVLVRRFSLYAKKLYECSGYYSMGSSKIILSSNNETINFSAIRIKAVLHFSQTNLKKQFLQGQHQATFLYNSVAVIDMNSAFRSFS